MSELLELTLVSASTPGAGTTDGLLENVPLASSELVTSPGLRTPLAGAAMREDVEAELEVDGDRDCSFWICDCVELDDSTCVLDVWAKAGAAASATAAREI